MPVRVCLEESLRIIGSVAREYAPPVVPASALGSWFWCRLKAWHNTTLFNTGWLRKVRLGEAELDGLAVLWAAELAKKANPRIIVGKLIHGEPLGDVVREAGEFSLAVRLARERGRLMGEILGGRLPLGLIDPDEYEEQLRRYSGASDIVEYFRREKWPLIARRAKGFMVIGVPDRIEMASGGVRVVELKTTSRPRRQLARTISYRAALAQLAAYSWILVERWPVEEAVLVFRDHSGRLIARKVFDPDELAGYFEEKLLPVAESLASREPPEPPEKPPCRSCEYNFEKLLQHHAGVG